MVLYHPSRKDPSIYTKCNAGNVADCRNRGEHIDARNEQELTQIMEQKLVDAGYEEVPYSGTNSYRMGSPVGETPVVQDTGCLLTPAYNTSIKNPRTTGQRLRLLKERLGLHPVRAKNYQGERLYHSTRDGNPPAGVHQVRDATPMGDMDQARNKPAGALWLSAGEQQPNGAVVTEWEKWAQEEGMGSTSQHVYEPVLDEQTIVLDLDDEKNKVGLASFRRSNQYGLGEYYDYDALKSLGVDVVVGGRDKENLRVWDVRSAAVLNGRVVLGWHQHDTGDAGVRGYWDD